MQREPLTPPAAHPTIGDVISAPGSRRGIWLAWIGANAVGELLGLGFVFAGGFALFALVGEPTTAAAALGLVGAAALLGAVEGAVVGTAQAFVLRPLFPRMARRAWVAATVVGAVVTWLLGMIPSTLGSFQSSPAEGPPPEPPSWLVPLLAAALGAVGGLLLAAAQGWVLRRHARGAGWWLLANALAWAVGMPWIFWLVGITVAERRTLASFLLFLLGLGVAGALVGAVHGAFLVRVLAPRARTA